MIIRLLFDKNLRGRLLEEAAKVLIRRQNKNNFIFVCKNFDNIQEILIKYRLNGSKVKEIIDFVSEDKWRTDLIEFVLNNKDSRIIEKINFYEVKSKLEKTKRRYDSCESNHKFMKTVNLIEKADTFLISLVLFENWKLSLNVYSYEDIKFRVYDSVKNHSGNNIKNE